MDEYAAHLKLMLATRIGYCLLAVVLVQGAVIWVWLVWALLGRFL